MNIIITGGHGFIGSSLIKNLIDNNNILNIDNNSYSSMPESLTIINKKKNYFFKKIDIKNYNNLKKVIFDFKPEIIFHLAAESHVDNSIESPKSFINSNIIGTYNILEIIRSYLKKDYIKGFKYIHISTDEVFGSIGKKSKKTFTENSKFLPNSPYSASKASSDLLVRAWNKTFDLPVITTNCCNNFGPWQYPEKLIPVIINSCINFSDIPIYGKGDNVREWMYVNDHVKYLVNLSKKGKIGETYNIGSGYEISNIKIAQKICKYFDKKFNKSSSYLNLIKFVKDRKGHDFKYSINSSKIHKIIPNYSKNSFNKNFYNTIDWYIENKIWLKNKIKKI